MKSQKAEEIQRMGKERKASTITSEREPLAGIDTVKMEQEAVGASEAKDGEAGRFAATSGLAVILGQLVAYFNNRASIDDLDVLSFSLHHLFCRVDFLYDKALPLLAELTAIAHGKTAQLDARLRQQTWLQLQTINRSLDRMEPLCHLLSDATECILERFDLSHEMLSLPESAETPETPAPAHLAENEGSDWLQAIDSGHWDSSFNAVTQSLLSWQNHYHTLLPFTVQFAHLLPTIPSLPELDSAFATMLDSAGAIYGDILPGFRAILDEDEAIVTALLYDLMQQSDQLLIKFDSTLEPISALIKHYTLGPDLS